MRLENIRGLSFYGATRFMFGCLCVVVGWHLSVGTRALVCVRFRTYSCACVSTVGHGHNCACPRQLQTVCLDLQTFLHAGSPNRARACKLWRLRLPGATRLIQNSVLKGYIFVFLGREFGYDFGHCVRCFKAAAESDAAVS